MSAGDPEIRGFDGNAFQFEGQAGSFYEALGGSGHQVNSLQLIHVLQSQSVEAPKACCKQVP